MTRHMDRAALQVQAPLFQRTFAFRTNPQIAGVGRDRRARLSHQEASFHSKRFSVASEPHQRPMERKPAVAVIFHHVGPYHHARLNAAADKLSVTGIEWSARGYDAWGTAATPARYHKVSLFPEATADCPGKL